MRIAAWVAREVIPCEASVRAWLARSRLTHEDIDEVIQDSYCRLAMLETVDHIDRPDAYFFSIARNLLLRRLKRQRVVPIHTIAEIEAYCSDDSPSPEQQAGARLDYRRLLAMIANLPEPCREIVRLRKIEGLSQREIAVRLGVTEAVVEKRVWQSVRAIQKEWAAGAVAAASRMDALDRHDGSAGRRNR